MNAPAQQQTAPAQGATAARKDLLEDFIAESAWSASVTCGLIQTYCEIKDHAALVYSVKRLVAYTKCIAQSVNDLSRLKAESEAGK